MKSILFVLLLSNLVVCKGVLNSNSDKKALAVFQENLTIVRERVENKKAFDVVKVNSAIVFLENITGIESHSDGNYFGRYNPTQSDYSHWLKWFEKNKSRLYWDEKDQKVKVK